MLVIFVAVSVEICAGLVVRFAKGRSQNSPPMFIIETLVTFDITLRNKLRNVADPDLYVNLF